MKLGLALGVEFPNWNTEAGGFVGCAPNAGGALDPKLKLGVALKAGGWAAPTTDWAPNANGVDAGALVPPNPLEGTDPNAGGAGAGVAPKDKPVVFGAESPKAGVLPRVPDDEAGALNENGAVLAGPAPNEPNGGAVPAVEAGVEAAPKENGTVPLLVVDVAAGLAEGCGPKENNPEEAFAVVDAGAPVQITRLLKKFYDSKI